MGQGDRRAVNGISRVREPLATHYGRQVGGQHPVSHSRVVTRRIVEQADSVLDILPGEREVTPLKTAQDLHERASAVIVRQISVLLNPDIVNLYQGSDMGQSFTPGIQQTIVVVARLVTGGHVDAAQQFARPRTPVSPWRARKRANTASSVGSMSRSKQLLSEARMMFRAAQRRNAITWSILVMLPYPGIAACAAATNSASVTWFIPNSNVTSKGEYLPRPSAVH
jgi:hypothetical protein